MAGFISAHFGGKTWVWIALWWNSLIDERSPNRGNFTAVRGELPEGLNPEKHVCKNGNGRSQSHCSERLHCELSPHTPRFFLPLFDCALQRKGKGFVERYYVEDVGIRRRVFAEVLGAAGIDVVWVEASAHAGILGNNLLLPTWDVGFSRYIGWKLWVNNQAGQWRHQLVGRIDRVFVREIRRAWLGRGKLFVHPRQQILKRLLKRYWHQDIIDMHRAACRFRQWLEDRFPTNDASLDEVCLVFQRGLSDDRRWSDLEEVCNGVRQAGLSPVVVQTGELSFLDQVNLVRRASAIVAIRGSAFAHLWWAPQNTKAVIIDAGRPWQFVYLGHSELLKRPCSHNFVLESGGDEPGIRKGPEGISVQPEVLRKMCEAAR